MDVITVGQQIAIANGYFAIALCKLKKPVQCNDLQPHCDISILCYRATQQDRLTPVCELCILCSVETRFITIDQARIAT